MTAGTRWQLPGGHEAAVARIKESFCYDPVSGNITHAKNKFAQHSRVAVAGTRAGSIRRDDHRAYVSCSLGKRDVPGHVVAWVCHYGKLPDGVVDHINGDGADNRIANLRDCSSAMNIRNRRLNKNSNSGFKGVSWYPDVRKWRARITVDGRKQCLGFFEKAEDAAAAYDAGALQLHGEFARTNAALGLIPAQYIPRKLCKAMPSRYLKGAVPPEDVEEALL